MKRLVAIGILLVLIFTPVAGLDCAPAVPEAELPIPEVPADEGETAF